MQGSWLTRVLGALIALGFLVLFAGVIGTVIAFVLPVALVLVGIVFVQAWAMRRTMGPAILAARQTFRETALTLMGRIAKCDGRISEQEIAVTEQLMAHLGLAGEQRQQGIEMFRRGAEPDFSVDAQLDNYVAHCGRHPALHRMLILFLFTTAAADGAMSAAEHELVYHVGARIGISQAELDQLLRSFVAQDAFSHAGAAPHANVLADAYAALGVDPSADDRTAKQAYRRLMSQYHPDKLIAEGMPEDMVRMATERTQEIQNAWEVIRKARGL